MTSGRPATYAGGVAAVRTTTANAFRAVAIATAAALLVTACGGSNSHYVVNEPAQTYFKVPKDWEVIRIVDSELDEFLVNNSWAVFFAPEGLQPDALNDLDQSPAPLGLAMIGQIEQGEFDTFSDLRLRAITYTDAMGELAYVDPLEVSTSQDDDIVRIYGAQTIARDGLRGYRIRYQIASGPDAAPLVYDKIQLIHDATHTFYLFRVTCQVACFSEYSGDINTIFDSLRVRRDQP